ncbi:endoglucanase [Colletotrichum scovillei]|uniref:endoglucanase n=1 Tax=Colletotrichum scovillei TaxID=1209932 RepID=UPI0015C32500|nr:endoglucanase [Colletotrichum scovillei]KAF4777605.1 endoglucanase [Colletotrichum scovillei]
MNQIFLLASMLASTTSGHVVLENPKPFKFVADGPTNPISSTGDDFPCKIPSGASYIIDGAPTFALSADANPTKDSKWMVIHSIEGGCPARNQKGNLEGPNEDKYPFKIPSSIAPGDYVFAWIWLARVGGQPEYYMNCAPITVTGGAGGADSTKKKRGPLADRRMSLAKREEFPELFMANIGEVAGGCTTGEALNAQVPIAFPNRGLYFDRPEGDNLYKQPCDGNPNAGTPVEAPAGGDVPAGTIVTSVPTSSIVGGSSLLPPIATETSIIASPSNNSPQEPAPSTAPAEPTAPVEPTVPITPTAPAGSSIPPAPTASMISPIETPVPTGIIPTPFISFITITITATDCGASATPGAPASEPTTVPTSSPDSPTPDPDSDEDSDSEPDSCTEGYLTCLEDETHFATCTGGKLTAPQPIAPGFKCASGEGEGLDISPIGGEY